MPRIVSNNLLSPTAFGLSTLIIAGPPQTIWFVNSYCSATVRFPEYFNAVGN